MRKLFNLTLLTFVIFGIFFSCTVDTPATKPTTPQADDSAYAGTWIYKTDPVTEEYKLILNSNGKYDYSYKNHDTTDRLTQTGSFSISDNTITFTIDSFSSSGAAEPATFMPGDKCTISLTEGTITIKNGTVLRKQ